MDKKTALVILGMSVVTYLPRVLPIIVLSKIRMPEWFMRWLKYIPTAVLSALLVPELFVSGQTVNLSFSNRNLLAALPCFFMAYKTKNLFLTVVTGITAMMILNFVSG